MRAPSSWPLAFPRRLFWHSIYQSSSFCSILKPRNMQICCPDFALNSMLFLMFSVFLFHWCYPEIGWALGGGDHPYPLVTWLALWGIVVILGNEEGLLPPLWPAACWLVLALEGYLPGTLVLMLSKEGIPSIKLGMFWKSRGVELRGKQWLFPEA